MVFNIVTHKDLIMVLHVVVLPKYLVNDLLSDYELFKIIEKNLIISSKIYSDITMHQELLILHTICFNFPKSSQSYLTFALSDK